MTDTLFTGHDHDMHRDAEISDCGRYRYRLGRRWEGDREWQDADGSWHAESPSSCCFVMLNPSMADAEIDDPTIRRCIGFAKSWGCGSLEVLNLFALRATDPRELKVVADPVGPLNDATFQFASWAYDIIVAAWGANGGYMGRDLAVMRILGNVPVKCLGTTKAGHPRHPLYIKADTPLIQFNSPAIQP